MKPRIRLPDRGMVTVEVAVTAPTLVVFLLVALTAIRAIITQMVCVDMAREVALAEARGQPWPPGVTAHVEVDRASDLIRTRVRREVRPLGPHLPAIGIDGTAIAMREPGSPQ